MHTHRRPGRHHVLASTAPVGKWEQLTWLATARTEVSGTRKSDDMTVYEEPVLCIWRAKRNTVDGGLFWVRGDYVS